MFFALDVLSLTPISGRRMDARRTNLRMNNMHFLRSLLHSSDDFIPTFDFHFFAFKLWCVYVLYLLFVAIIIAIVDSKPFLSLVRIAICNILLAPMTAIGFEKLTRKTYSFAPFSVKKCANASGNFQRAETVHVVRE